MTLPSTSGLEVNQSATPGAAQLRMKLLRITGAPDPEYTPYPQLTITLETTVEEDGTDIPPSLFVRVKPHTTESAPSQVSTTTAISPCGAEITVFSAPSRPRRRARFLRNLTGS